MPIYEFYCAACHTIFSFLSKTINTTGIPKCPKCRRKLQKQVSMFAVAGGATEDDGSDGLPIDENRMERAMEALAGDAEKLNEEDPRQAAELMRKFSHMTGMEFGDGMQEALRRMEAGEDPDAIEADMGDLIESEDPFVAGGKKGRRRGRTTAPARDGTLYDM